jgi:hypothetical protein
VRLAEELDRLQPIQDLPNWSENLVLQVHDPATGVSVWAHWSRMPEASGVWESVLTCYLPGGALLTSRAFGHSPDRDLASSGPAGFRCVEPLRRWRLEFAGMARRVRTADVVAGPVADGPVEPLEIALDFDGVHPVWDARHRLAGSTWASGHLEQGGRIAGSVRCRDGGFAVDGHGFRDHSYGPRDYSGMAGNTWVSAVFPSGRALVTLAVWPAGSSEHASMGYVWDGSTMHDALRVDLPPLAGADGGPHTADIGMTTDLGEHRLHVAATHQMNYSMYAPVGMALGTAGPGFITVAECPAVVTWDGERAAGWFEKSYRLG